MEVARKYVVYEIDEASGHVNAAHVPGFYNGFDTEQEAINALVSADMCFQDYAIIPHVRLYK